MDIPEYLKNKLAAGDMKFAGAVTASVGSYENWLKEKKLVFSPEYTDHGPEHIASVLRGAVELLGQEAQETLSSEDAGILILAVLLHDCALHLSKEGFQALIAANSSWRPEKGKLLKKMADPPWPKLWEDFIKEALRFDQKKLMGLFGKVKEVRRPPAEGSWEDEDYLLVGEFLRRHHARLAHEIALGGVPGPGKDFLKLDEKLEPWQKDLAGFVARSHGLDLRAAVEKLDGSDQTFFRKVHPAFLMSLIRIADYLEITAPRAPRESLQVRRLRSPISGREWMKHQAVKDIRWDPVDPERFYIDVEPQDVNDVKTLLALQELLAGLQRELDACWAVLGQVYRGQAAFGLRLRRVCSSLDNLEKFAEEGDLPFIPVRASFEAAGGDLLKVLVGPLYNNDPGYAVRELLQNAVDACRELEDWKKQHPSRHAEGNDELEADVVITLREEKEGTGWLTVEDRGIGMTAEVIVNYFLKAGVSFRESEVWQRQHEDAVGRSRVLRSGRFGVGALATFLLSDEVEVTTRHASESRGIRFIARLEEPEIELKWWKRPVGTTICVPINSSEVFKKLDSIYSWEWYCLEKPSVRQIIWLEEKHGEYKHYTLPVRTEYPHEQEESIPHLDKYKSDSPPWRRLSQNVVDEVLWSFEAYPRMDVYNGFNLKGRKRRVLWPQEAEKIDFCLFQPRLSVMDSSGEVELDLLKTRMVKPWLFEKELVETLCRDILASLLVRTAGSKIEALRQIAHIYFQRSDNDYLNFVSLFHPAAGASPKERRLEMAGLERATTSWLFVTDEGITLEDPALHGLEPLLGRALFVLPQGGGLKNKLGRYDHRRIPRKNIFSRAINRLPRYFPMGIQTEMSYELDEYIQSRGYSSAVLLLPKTFWQGEKQRGGRQVLQYDEYESGWTIVRAGDDSPGWLIEQLISQAPAKEEMAQIFYLFPEGFTAEEPRNPLSRLWLELIGNRVIPFDRKKRRESLDKAYSVLDEEIKLWERLVSDDPEKRAEAIMYWIGSRPRKPWEPPL